MGAHSGLSAAERALAAAALGRAWGRACNRRNRILPEGAIPACGRGAMCQFSVGGRGLGLGDANPCRLLSCVFCGGKCLRRCIQPAAVWPVGRKPYAVPREKALGQRLNLQVRPYCVDKRKTKHSKSRFAPGPKPMEAKQCSECFFKGLKTSYFKNFASWLSPSAWVGTFSAAQTVAAMLPKPCRVPRLTPGCTVGPVISQGTYSRVWSVVAR